MNSIYSCSKNGNQKVCVVGIVGRCNLLQKDGALNQLVDHNVFMVSQFFNTTQQNYSLFYWTNITYSVMLI